MSERTGPTPTSTYDPETGDKIDLLTFLLEETLESGEVIGFAVATHPGVALYPEFVESVWEMAERGLAEKLRIEYDGVATATPVEHPAGDEGWDDHELDGREPPVRHDGSNTLVRRVPGANGPYRPTGRGAALDDQGAQAAGTEDATP